MHRHAVLAVSTLLLISGCASIAQVTSAHIGCPEQEIEIINERMGWGDHSWSARCRGRVYHCIAISGGKYSAPHISCKGEPNPVVASAPIVPNTPVRVGCQYDTQCKGNRVCQDGSCVDPGYSSGAASRSSRPSTPARIGTSAEVSGPGSGSGSNSGSGFGSKAGSGVGPGSDSRTPPAASHPVSEVTFEQRMGITVGDADKHATEQGLTANRGVVLLSVQPGSAAFRKNLRRGDIIVGLTYSQVKSLADLRRLSGPIQPGQSFHIIVQRGTKIFSFQMRL